MRVELPRGDYLLAAMVAVMCALIVGLLTILPAILFFDWLSLTSTNVWARLIPLFPIACGLFAAWRSLQKAKSDRTRDRLWNELRD